MFKLWWVLFGCSDDEALVQPQLVSSFGAEGLTQDEDEQQEQAAPQSNITWSSRDFHMSPKQGMQHTDGMKLVPALTSNDVCVTKPNWSVLLQCVLCWLDLPCALMRYHFVQVSKEMKWRSLQACLSMRSAAGWSHIQQQSRSMPAFWPSDRLQSVADCIKRYHLCNNGSKTDPVLLDGMYMIDTACWRVNEEEGMKSTSMALLLYFVAW